MEAIIFMDLISTKTDLFTSYDFSMAKNLFDEKVGYPEILAELANTEVAPMDPKEYKGNQFILDIGDKQYEYTFKKDSPSSFEQYEDATNKTIEEVEVKTEKVYAH